MKNTIIAILAIASLTFGGLWMRQNQKSLESQTAIAELHDNIAVLEDQLHEQQNMTSSLQNRLHNTQATAIAKHEQASQLQQSLTNRLEAEAKAKAENPLAEMFKSQESRDLIKTQQKAVLGPMIEKNYAPLFSALQLAPEHSAMLKDLILKKTMTDAEAGMSLMAGDVEATKRTETLDQAKKQKDALNEEIKQFLGDENYAQFEAYEKTQPERMAINMFKDQQGSGSEALNAEQEAQLVQVLSQERQNFKFTTDFTDQSKFNGDFDSYFTDEKIQQFQTESEQLHEKYEDQARQILSPLQFEQFKKFLKGQMDMQNTGLRLARRMFGGRK